LAIHTPQLIETIVSEIEDLAAEAEFAEALNKLRIFAIDFAPELRFETRHLMSRLRVYEEQIRTGRTVTENITDISYGIFELLKNVYQLAKSQHVSSKAGNGGAEDGTWIAESTNDISVTNRVVPDSGQLRRELVQAGRDHASSLPVVLAEEIEKGFNSQSFALGPVSFGLKRGQIVAVIGRNGSGKTTLLNLLAGRSLQTRGSLSFPGLSEVRDWAVIRSKLRYISPRYASSRYNVRDTLEFAAASSGKLGIDNKQAVDDYLARYDLERYSSHAWHELSDGYRMRFELVRALIGTPKLLILDEPLAHLDIMARTSFLAELLELTSVISEPVSIVVSTHHLDEADLIADQLILLEAGKCKFAGSRTDLRNFLKGSVFHIIGALNRSTVSRAPIPGLQHVQSILGGVSLHFTESIAFPELLNRLGDLKDMQISAISDVSTSVRNLLSSSQL
jgi:ABC-2 type transport system ATP-binding protein